jgi:hypothetical protein
MIVKLLKFRSQIPTKDPQNCKNLVIKRGGGKCTSKQKDKVLRMRAWRKEGENARITYILLPIQRRGKLNKRC